MRRAASVKVKEKMTAILTQHKYHNLAHVYFYSIILHIKELQVDFEAKSITDEDHSGIQRLLRQVCVCICVFLDINVIYRSYFSKLHLTYQI
jgi:hypothetical protein